MAPPRKIKGKTTTLYIRADEDILSVASAIAALKKETISDVVRELLEKYVEENKGILGQTLEKMEGKG
jgi:antitoxin component of RelBE/YafQ-DinJ toxin-antitoxin module